MTAAAVLAAVRSALPSFHVGPAQPCSGCEVRDQKIAQQDQAAVVVGGTVAELIAKRDDAVAWARSAETQIVELVANSAEQARALRFTRGQVEQLQRDRSAAGQRHCRTADELAAARARVIELEASLAGNGAEQRIADAIREYAADAFAGRSPSAGRMLHALKSPVRPAVGDLACDDRRTSPSAAPGAVLPSSAAEDHHVTTSAPSGA